ncbi:PREDICTED: piggyBac transposable element-derived protein 4-like [Polistes dominula]|uniref:PiggyBac transposable element-derived protein 4-like n=1 Tax=Polistes dominula TaxID=743375 RepID=A0ABM1IJ07_POLDO|nr:PREDICTED: piggyBac transposable element-derived protein 4-like [Polistes dominula]
MEHKNLKKRRTVNENEQIDSDSCDENELATNVEQSPKKKLRNVLSTSESEETYDDIIDLCLLNAYCLYKSKTHKMISMEKFHLKLSNQIQKKYMKSTDCSDINSLRLIGRHFPSQYTSLGKNKLRRCVVCSKNDKRRESRYQCEECDVGLCVVPCFQIFHTKK